MPGTLSSEIGTDASGERALSESFKGEGLGGAPIMIATDGSEASLHALSAARVLSGALRAPVHMISVMEPIAAYVPAANVRALRPRWDAARIEARLASIRKQSRIAGGADDWTSDVVLGTDAPVIARLARQRHARVLVMGMHHHAAIDRWLGGDTVFDVVRLGDTPVLVVPRAMDEMPRTIVIGVDFSPLSEYAVREALELFPATAIIYLVHVVEPDSGISESSHHGPAYSVVVREGFARLTQALAVNAGMSVLPLERAGKRAHELVDVAREVHADLLVVGSYRRGLFRRLASGTVAAGVLRRADCPVLVIPEPPGAQLREAESFTRLARDGAADRVREVSARNSGRRAMVEIDDPGIGAQALALDYVLTGLAYDPRDQRLQIFLGGPDANGRRHVTHTITDPGTMDILPGSDGRDQVVRITDRAGQVLITFLS